MAAVAPLYPRPVIVRRAVHPRCSIGLAVGSAAGGGPLPVVLVDHRPSGVSSLGAGWCGRIPAESPSAGRSSACRTAGVRAGLAERWPGLACRSARAASVTLLSGGPVWTARTSGDPYRVQTTASWLAVSDGCLLPCWLIPWSVRQRCRRSWSPAPLPRSRKGCLTRLLLADRCPSTNSRDQQTTARGKTDKALELAGPSPS